ncbi:MAG: right-handed parallel beta-helix repeat-containing protein [bacterium]|nr:right-handed parallel beta-helix repeat-containing protein [bacterium]
MKHLIALLALLSAGAFGQTYYVATNGNDSAGGTFAAPWRTLQRGATMMYAGDTCFVRGGTYREAIVPARSGTAAARISYRAFAGEMAVVNGCEPLTNWISVGSNVWRAALAGNFYTSLYNFAMQVCIDGRMMYQARWPNGTVQPSYPAKSSLTADSIAKWTSADNWTYVIFDDANLKPASNGYYVGAGFYVQPNYNAWSWTLSGVVISQQGVRLTIKSRNSSGKDGSGTYYPAGARYYLYNLRSMLDSPFEWYHDQTGGWLYVCLPAGADPNQHVVEVKKRDWGFDLSNRSNTTLDGLALFGCSITTDRAAGGDGIGCTPSGGPYYPWRGAGSIAPSYNNIFENIRARYLTHVTDVSGHFFMQWGQGSGIVLSGTNHVLRNCVLQYSAGNGVSVIGRGHQIVSNIFTDMDYVSVDCSAINTGGAAATEDHEIAFNTIAHCGRSSITPRLLANSSTANLIARMHHNDMMECMLQDWDGGGVYTGGNGTFLRIDHNWVHDMTGYTVSGIYPDWGQNFVMDHNVIWNVEWGLHLQSTYNGAGIGNYLVYNNTIAVKNTSSAGYGPFGLVENSSQPQTGTVVRNNITVCYTPPSASGYKPMDDFTTATIADNLFTNNVLAPKFTDVYGYKFTLQSNSIARDTGAWIPSYTRDGVIVPGYNDPTNGLPDKGAYEYGMPAWRAGAGGPDMLVVTANVAAVDRDFVVTRSDARAPLAINFSVAGTATQVVHYAAAASWSLQFPMGVATQTVQLTALSAAALNKTVILTLSAGNTRYTVGAAGAATVTFVPEPALLLPLLLGSLRLKGFRF